MLRRSPFFDATRLPVDTIFLEMPRRRVSGARAAAVLRKRFEASWSEYVAGGDGRRPATGWIVARTPEGVEARSSALPSRERGIGLAFDLADKGDAVLRTGDVTAEEVKAAKHHRRDGAHSKTPPRPWPFVSHRVHPLWKHIARSRRSWSLECQDRALSAEDERRPRSGDRRSLPTLSVARSRRRSRTRARPGRT